MNQFHRFVVYIEYNEFLGGMDMDHNECKMKLENEITALKARVENLEQEFSEIELGAPKSIISSAHIGQIGTFVLGAIVLIGIFWL